MCIIVFYKHKTAYEMRISDWSSDVCSSDLLEQHGLRVLGGTTLFRLIHDPRAAALFNHLARAGILSRPFADQPDWLRFGLPGADEDWLRLNADRKSTRLNSSH